MINIHVSMMLEHIAHLLEARGENPFKLRAYKRAAEAIKNMKEDVSIVYKNGDLEKVAGIGRGISKKVAEIIDTGKSSYLEELKESTPEVLLEVLTIPGVGPKKARLFHKYLAIENLEELEDACCRKELRKLPGVGAKLEFNILKHIRKMKSGLMSISLATARPVVGELVERLKSSNNMSEVSISGALRRMSDNVNRASIVVGASCEDEVTRYLSDFIDILKVDKLAAGKYRVVFASHIPVEITIAEPQKFSSVLWLDTGGQEHCKAVLERIKKLNKKVLEKEFGANSTFESEAKLLPLVGRSEYEFYESAGMEYVVPELRENNGEIEAAIAGTLPPLIQAHDIKGDLHVHTSWSDGGNTIEEMARAALDMGYEYIAICDHSKSLNVAGGLTEKQLMEQVEEIREVNEKFSHIEILAGSEVDIKEDGSLDYSRECIKELDMVIASIHTGFSQDVHKMTGRIEKAMENEDVDIIAHPTGRLIGRRSGYELDMDRLLEVAEKTGTILEINAYPDRLDLNHEYARRCKDMGIKIVINTDAHSIEQMKYMKFGLGVARKGWLEKDNVINTYSREGLPF